MDVFDLASIFEISTGAPQTKQRSKCFFNKPAAFSYIRTEMSICLSCLCVGHCIFIRTEFFEGFRIEEILIGPAQMGQISFLEKSLTENDIGVSTLL
jgi:hypothetical protein